MFRWMKRTVYVLCLICLCLYFSNISYAGELDTSKEVTNENGNTQIPQKVHEYKTGVVKICLYVEDGTNKRDIRQGTGILLGKDGQQIILTDSSFLELDSKTTEAVRRQYGMETSQNVETGIALILDMNTRIELEVRNSGSGYAVLEAGDLLENMQILRLGDSKSLQIRDNLYVLGYGGSSDIIGSSGLPNIELQINSCQIAALDEEDIKTDYLIQSGEIGAPVMDSDGYVVGILVKDQNGVLTIKSIDNIKSILDVLGIAYDSNAQGSDYNKVTKEIRQELESTLLECQELAVQKDKYTKKSLDKLKEAINSTMELMASDKQTSDEYQNCIDNLNKYKKKLRSINYPYHVVQVVLAILIAMFLWFAIRNKMQIRMLMGENMEYANAVPSSQKKIQKPVTIVEEVPVNSVEKTPEMQVNRVYTIAKLKRCDTGQEISIQSNVFRIGKNANTTDYTIMDNSSISRNHATIEVVNGVYCIVDQNSTNHTYVNGIELVPGKYKELQNGDMIQLSNIQFQFYISNNL